MAQYKVIHDPLCRALKRWPYHDDLIQHVSGCEFIAASASANVKTSLRNYFDDRYRYRHWHSRVQFGREVFLWAFKSKLKNLATFNPTITREIPLRRMCHLKACKYRTQPRLANAVVTCIFPPQHMLSLSFYYQIASSQVILTNSPLLGFHSPNTGGAFMLRLFCLRFCRSIGTIRP